MIKILACIFALTLSLCSCSKWSDKTPTLPIVTTAPNNINAIEPTITHTPKTPPRTHDNDSSYAKIDQEEIVIYTDPYPYTDYVYRNFNRISPQNISPRIEIRDNVFVLTPYLIGDYFSFYDITQWDDSPRENDLFGFSEDFWPGCSIWCGLFEFIEATATSSLVESETLQHLSDNISSPVKTNVWCEGIEGYGIGESIKISHLLARYHNLAWSEDYYTYTLDNTDAPENYFYTSLCVANGYTKNERLWHENSRVKVLKLFVNDIFYAYIELDDTPLPQYIPLYDLNNVTCSEVVFRFEIAEVYPGNLYEDTCITGIQIGFSGLSGH